MAHVLLLFLREKPLGINMVWCVWMFVCRLVADVGLRLFIGWDRVAARAVWLPLLCRINTYTHFTWFRFLSMY